MFLSTPLKYNNINFFVNLLKWIISNYDFVLFFHFLKSSNNYFLPIRHKRFTANIGVSLFTSSIFRKIFFLNKYMDIFPGIYLILYSQKLISLDSFFKDNFFSVSIFLPFALLYKRKFIFINNQIINKLFVFNKQITKRFVFFSLYKTLLFVIKSLSILRKDFKI